MARWVDGRSYIAGIGRRWPLHDRTLVGKHPSVNASLCPNQRCARVVGRLRANHPGYALRSADRAEIGDHRVDAFTARDCARIAYERSRSGPPLVLIHGGWADHTSWSLVAPRLAEHFTVYAVDRRGCGQSDPYGQEYEMVQDFQDVAAVVDAVGTSVNLVGHSIGGFCALHGALLTHNVNRLVLYEPPLGGPEVIQDPVLDHIEALIAAGDCNLDRILS